MIKQSFKGTALELKVAHFLMSKPVTSTEGSMGTRKTSVHCARERRHEPDGWRECAAVSRPRNSGPSEHTGQVVAQAVEGVIERELPRRLAAHFVVDLAQRQHERILPCKVLKRAEGAGGKRQRETG